MAGVSSATSLDMSTSESTVSRCEPMVVCDRSASTVVREDSLKVVDEFDDLKRAVSDVKYEF